MMEVTISGMMAMRSSRRKTSASGSAMGRMPSPNTRPANMPRKNPMKMVWVRDSFFMPPVCYYIKNPAKSYWFLIAAGQPPPPHPRLPTTPSHTRPERNISWKTLSRH
jgi:hypothetical protein